MYELNTDPSFDINRTKEYILSIQVSLDGFYFSLIHPVENRLLALKKNSLTISSENFLGRRFLEWSGEQELFQKKYAAIRIIFSTEKFTFVPGDLYSKDKQDDICRLVFGKQNGYSVIENSLENVSCHILFYIPNELVKALDKTFPGYVLVHPLTAISKLAGKWLEKNDTTMVLFFEKKYFYLLLFHKEKLQLANSFSFQHANDVTFYILSVLKQNGISYKNTSLLMAGEIMPDGDITEAIKKYVGNIDMLLPAIDYNPNIFKESLHHLLTFC